MENNDLIPKLPIHHIREGARAGFPFSYSVKRGRNGEYVKELLISRKEKSKTITASTINRALETALEAQKADGCVKGLKKLGTFGASYLYPIFCEFGLISRTAQSVIDV